MNTPGAKNQGLVSTTLGDVRKVGQENPLKSEGGGAMTRKEITHDGLPRDLGRQNLGKGGVLGNDLGLRAINKRKHRGWQKTIGEARQEESITEFGARKHTGVKRLKTLRKKRKK